MVHLGQERDVLPLALPLAQARHEIQREVGITAQAVACGAALLFFADELCEHIHPRVQQVAHRVGIIAANVGPLGERAIEEAPRLEIKLRYPDVLRQLSALEGFQILQLGIAYEESLQEGLHQAPFELACIARLTQCERSEDAQVNPRILARPPKEFVD